MSGAAPFSVVVADDHMIVRQSLVQMFEAEPRLHVIGEAADGLAAVAVAKKTQPDLLVLDFAMPMATGIEVIEEVRRWSPSTRIAVLTGVRADGILRHLYESGVEGIFLKSSDTTDWMSSLIAICEGERIIDAAVERLVSDNVQSGASLTGRERQILFCVARGETNTVIADHLGISANTVDRHRTNIMRKLGVHSTAALLVRAFRDGLLNSSDGQ